MPLSQFVKTYPMKGKSEKTLVFSSKTSALVSMDKPLFERVTRGDLLEKEKEQLEKIGIWAKNLKTEKKDALGWLKKANRLRKTSNTVVVLNMKCNLACPYCFEGKLVSGVTMTKTTADRVVKFLSTPNNQSVQFYGGEPLMSEEHIHYIAGKLQKSAKKNGTEFAFSLVTNGTLLTKKRVKELLPLGFKGVQITLDGPKETHNQSRPYRNKKGSFNRIIKNLKETCDLIEVGVVGNYTSKNYRRYPELLDYLIEQGITPDRLKSLQFYPAATNKGEFALPDYTDGCVSANEPWLSKATLYLRSEIIKRGFPIQKIRPSTCMIEFDKDLVINYDGTLYKCPAFIGRKGLEVGSLATGVQDYRKSHKLGYWKKEECMECAYLPICFGGCRYIKLLRDGNFDDVDCKKQYLDATLEKTLLQDLRLKPKIVGI